MRAHDRCVDHGIFIVGFLRQMLENPGPNAGLGPAAEAHGPLAGPAAFFVSANLREAAI